MKEIIVSAILSMFTAASYAVFLRNLMFSGGLGATEVLRAAQRNSEILMSSLLVSLFSGAAAGLCFEASRLLAIFDYAWLAAFYVVPEGLAVPYARQLGGGPVMAGLLLSAMPTGMGVGVVAFGRLVAPARRMQVMAPMAACCCLPLLACWLRPGLAATMVIFATTGMLSAYQLAANAAFVRALPDRFRSQAFGLVMTGFSLGQSAALVAAGALAQALPVTSVIAISGAVGTVAAAVLGVRWSYAAAGGLAVTDSPMAARRGRPTPSAEGSQEVQM